MADLGVPGFGVDGVRWSGITARRCTGTGSRGRTRPIIVRCRGRSWSCTFHGHGGSRRRTCRSTEILVSGNGFTAELGIGFTTGKRETTGMETQHGGGTGTNTESGTRWLLAGISSSMRRAPGTCTRRGGSSSTCKEPKLGGTRRGDVRGRRRSEKGGQGQETGRGRGGAAAGARCPWRPGGARQRSCRGRSAGGWKQKSKAERGR